MRERIASRLSSRPPEASARDGEAEVETAETVGRERRIDDPFRAALVRPGGVGTTAEGAVIEMGGNICGTL
jgi:hypothetical protein